MSDELQEANVSRALPHTILTQDSILVNN